MSERFQVRSLTGWSIITGQRGTSYWVLDTETHKNVSGELYYSDRGMGARGELRKQGAENLCRRLNREHEILLSGGSIHGPRGRTRVKWAARS